ncbi:MAG: 2-amino-4-hydroxy-6-hydroxymethyldihydropteridine diphosphokinase [gamma proteobacterium symbiont of Bathyaustriella thionipta]|nr:2-amino-4-hydroxy-6-hydroxymethyldihydropteridine diphosphokinase [gamma proteobacterium symbiont of Bathyaustriella thionipta]MCU7948635.1 2-amino-4-hydroxy-6-hydroxymethyldihydropteridine diphosphokinase [gamma proteobacterium symbiont of Bathyaustriella thionipta]MCU7953041.1 2-amino-4-hydroxy-6-hydroxymethyldihydropteridine diphosphokinase [gamma proteobacterium symbiont of Bathyaustriella thionipta]MCU7955359.1 2-amino-4-hydroxy-6-hydroxymethyldihydropteridine diphosphokinase [gamma prot
MKCYIGLGSNLAEPLIQLQTALQQIEKEPELQLGKVSSFYQSKALILPDAPPQNDYINAVALLETDLSAALLLQKLHKIEASQGRERNEKWGARTLDLDILLYGDLHIQTKILTIPHAQMQYRNFVLHPLFEIAGAIDIPGLGSLSEMAQKIAWDGLKKLTKH